MPTHRQQPRGQVFDQSADQVATSNSTVTAFLGPRRQPLWMTMSKPAKPTPRHQRPAQISPLHASAAQSIRLLQSQSSQGALPSPTPSDSPSPPIITTLESPDPLVPASAPNIPETSAPNPHTTALFVLAQDSEPESALDTSNRNPAAGEVTSWPSTELPAVLGAQFPITPLPQEGVPESSLITAQMEPPGANESTPQQQPGTAQEGDVALGVIAPSVPDQSSQPRRQDENEERSAKRRRVSENFRFSAFLPELEQSIATLSGEKSIAGLVEQPRAALLKEACHKEDGFFVALHQLYATWSIRPPVAHEYLRSDPEQVDAAFGIIEQLLKKNDSLRPHILQWFSTFPRPLPELLDPTDSPYRPVVDDVALFLGKLALRYQHLLTAISQRRYPCLVDELLGDLSCYSVVLQKILFTANRRRLGVPEGGFAVQMDDLFQTDQQQHLDKSGTWIAMSPHPSEQEKAHRITQNTMLSQQYFNLLQMSNDQRRGSSQAAAQSPAHSNPQSPAPQQGPMLQAHQQQQQQQQQPPPQQPARQPSMALPQNTPAAGYGPNGPQQTARPSNDLNAPNAPQSYSPALPQGAPPVSNTVRPPTALPQRSQIPQMPQMMMPQMIPQMMPTMMPYMMHQMGLMGSMGPLPDMAQMQQSPVVPGNASMRGNTSHATTLRATQRQAVPAVGQAGTGFQPMRQNVTPQQSSARQAQQARPAQNRRPQQQSQQQQAQEMYAAQQSPSTPVPQWPMPFFQDPNLQMPGFYGTMGSADPSASLASQPALPAHSPGGNPADPTAPSPLGPWFHPGYMNMPMFGTMQPWTGVHPALLRSLQQQTRTSSLQQQPIAINDNFFPSPGHVVSRTEMPGDPHERKAIMMSLHQADIRSPPRVRRTSQNVDKSVRYYQSIKSLPLVPTLVPEQSYVYDLEFLVTDAEFALLSKTTKQEGEMLSSVEYFDGSLRWRLRCCEATTEPESLTEYDWAVMESHWPEHIHMLLNNNTLTVRRASHNGKDLAVELTAFIKRGMNLLRVVVPITKGSRSSARKVHMIAVEMVETLRHSDIVALIWKDGAVPEAETLHRIASRLGRGSGSDGDDEGVAAALDKLSIDLADPFSATLFQIPARGAACKHLECFDLDTWLNTRPPSKPTPKCPHPDGTACACPKYSEPSNPDKWKCPICGGDARPYSLRIDGFLLNVRAELVRQGKTKAKSMLVGPDGSWDAVIEMDDGDEDSDDDDIPLAAKAAMKKQKARSASLAGSKSREPVIIELD